MQFNCVQRFAFVLLVAVFVFACSVWRGAVFTPL